MGCAEIVARMANEKLVETTVLRIAGVESMSADLEDLCQMVYVTLLEYDRVKLTRIVQDGKAGSFVARVVCWNLRSRTSRFHYAIKAFRQRCDEYASVEAIA